MSKFQCSQEVQDKVTDFEMSDKAFKAAWDSFEQSVRAQLEYLDKLREVRNEKLDVAVRLLRAEAVEADITKVKLIKQGPFSVQKKWSEFYAPEKFVGILKDKGLYDQAVAAKVIEERIEVAKFPEAKSFLEAHGVLKEFEECEDGLELTPAVSGPKPIPPFAAEVKSK